MSDGNRKKLISLMTRKKIPIIEDDAFGDLFYGGTRPSTLKSFDTKGWVLYCSSFSKTLAPGLRVGWTVPGRFADKAKALKSNLSSSTANLNQQIIVQYLKNDSFERHLRHLRHELKKQMSDLKRAVIRYFPKDTRISNPDGGLNLWIQLNDSIDTVALHNEALLDNLLVAPGLIFSVTGKYRNCIRLGCGKPFNKELENQVKKLGQLIYDLIV